MRRVLVVLLVIALALVPGCRSQQALAESKAEARIAEAERLAAAKDYDKAIEAYAQAASQIPAGELRDEALTAAASALTAKLESKPLPEQVAETDRFLDRIATGLLPLGAHNWLSSRLVSESKKELAESRRVWLAGARALGSQSGGRSATASSTAPAAAAPRKGLAPAQLQRIAKAVPALGQPPAMQKLYLSLAALSLETQRAERARAAFVKVGPTRSSLRNLREAETRLVRAISASQSLMDTVQ